MEIPFFGEVGTVKKAMKFVTNFALAKRTFSLAYFCVTPTAQFYRESMVSCPEGS